MLFFFVIVKLFFNTSQIRYAVYLFNVVSFYHDIRITLRYNLFKLATKITLKNGRFSIKLVRQLVILSPPQAYNIFLNLIFTEFAYSFDETNARFYNKLLHLFGFA